MARTGETVFATTLEMDKVCYAAVRALLARELRVLPNDDLTPELAAALRPIRHRAELIFCADDGSMLRPGQFQEVLWAAQRRAGLRRIKWHDLRHSYASILASGGMPLFLIRGLLGHSSVKMTERYAHLAASQTAAYMPLLSAAAPSKPTPPAPISGPEVGPNTLAPRSSRPGSISDGLTGNRQRRRAPFRRR